MSRFIIKTACTSDVKQCHSFQAIDFVGQNRENTQAIPSLANLRFVRSCRNSFMSMLRPRSTNLERAVPGFTIQALQKNTKVSRPPSARALRQRLPPSTTFRKFYERGDFPLIIEHGSRGNKIIWKTDLQQLDYHYYLPLFFDGLCEIKHPYSFLAKQGIYDMIEHGGQRLLPVLPQLIGPIRKALNTRHGQVLTTTLHIVQDMVKRVDGMGESLVPHYRQILPVLNLFKNRNINTGDGIVYGQLKKENLGDLIQDTLELLEMRGGDDAYYHIKYMIPTYESCLGKPIRMETSAAR